MYADEADLLNVALFGFTAKQWRESNPELAKKNNVRDFATINELTVMSNLETHNAELIKRGMEKNEGIDSLLFLVYSSDITYSMLHFCTDM